MGREGNLLPQDKEAEIGIGLVCPFVSLAGQAGDREVCSQRQKKLVDACLVHLEDGLGVGGKFSLLGVLLVQKVASILLGRWVVGCPFLPFWGEALSDLLFLCQCDA